MKMSSTDNDSNFWKLSSYWMILTVRILHKGVGIYVEGETLENILIEINDASSTRNS